MNRELFWFGIVGVSALAVHFIAVSLVLVPIGAPPLLANVAAFLVAFQVSYWGHRRLTFRAQDVAHSQSAPRFFAVACLSFAVNETLYFILLRYSALDYRAALLIVLFAVAVLTFALSKLWAFAGANAA